jgi:nucleotide-binding universal stress UspA family protein
MSGRMCPIGRMEKVLVATDGSEASRNAVVAGLDLAKICSSKIELIAVAVVLTNLEYDSALPWVIEDAEKEMQKKLEDVRDLVKQAGANCKIIVHRGEDPYREIIDEAVMNKVDIIVMGTHGRTGIKRFVMGSVAGNVIGHAPCKVLVVPAGAKIDYGTLLVATDGSIHGDAAVSDAVAIAKRCDSSLIVLSVASSDEEIPTAEEIVKRALEVADKEGIRKEGIVLRGRAEEAIVEVAGQKSAGLILMGSHGRTGLMSVLMGSVTERVLGHGNTAVLVAKTR